MAPRKRSGLCGRAGAVEWPTVALCVAIYGGWLLATLFHDRIAPPLRIGVGGWLIAWHGSLQHEAIHGHPTRWRRVNTAVAAWPLALWLPYVLYRRGHLAHHATDALTVPGADPESRYLTLPAGRMGEARRWAHAVQSTLLGRLLAGPPIEVGAFLFAEARRLARGDADRMRVWAAHLGLCAMLLAWLVGVCRMGLAEYLLAFVYPGMSLTLLRSFAEHRADADPDRRIALVEHAPLLGLLFLNNNLHALHHRRPALAWHRLPGAYRGARARLVSANGGLVYDGYREVFARYLLRPHDRLVHPAPGGEAGPW